MPEPRTTLDHVAQAAGVSRMTVSNTYSRPTLVAPATRERVLAAASEIGYGGPSPVGRTLRRGSTRVLGMVLNIGIPYAFSDPGAAEFMRGVAQGTDEADLSLQIIHASGPSAARRVNDTAVDAVIAWCLGAQDPALMAAIERRIPVVAFGGASGIPGVPYVHADNFGGARSAARHLIDLGIRRFATIGSSLDWEQFDDRISGWRAALAEADIDWSSALHLEEVGNSRAAGRNAGAAFLDAYEPGEPWGILAVTDVVALGAMQTLRAAGIDVPDDVAIAGFDDIEEASASAPGLTTVRQDILALGRECALRAAGLLDGPTAAHPTSLVVRGSTDPKGLAQLRDV